MKEKNTGFPPATERTLNILEYFAAHPYPLSVSEVASALSIPVSSAYRIIRCLAHYGYLYENLYAPDKYNMGYKMGYLSKMAYNGSDVESVSLPFMKQITDNLNMACQLSVLNQGTVLTINQTLPSHIVAVVARLGEPIPITASAAGKILFTFLPEKKREEQLDLAWKYVVPYTEKTIVDKQIFLEHLKTIRNLGYGTDFEEYALGVGCIAFPIFPVRGPAPLAALTTTGPIERFADRGLFQDIVSCTKEAALQISKKII